MLEPTIKFQRNLRRFVFNSKQQIPCEDKNYHNAVALTDDIIEMPNFKWAGDGTQPWDHADIRWPKTCKHCGYAFKESDEWQHNLERLWRKVGTDEEYTIKNAPSGAMWYADWGTWPGPDGKSLYVKLPDGVEWCIDGLATNSDKPWSRTGVPPTITARPSILTSNYHGFLTDGILRSC